MLNTPPQVRCSATMPNLEWHRSKAGFGKGLVNVSTSWSQAWQEPDALELGS